MWQEDICPCIVSTSITWLRGTCAGRKIDRLLSGKELLLLQGFDATLEGKTAHVFSQKELIDLSGNAFCGPVLYAVVTAIVACVPWATAFRAKRHAAHARGPAASAQPPAIPLQAPPTVSDDQSSDHDGSMLFQEEAGESEEMDPDSILDVSSECDFHHEGSARLLGRSFSFGPRLCASSQLWLRASCKVE